VSDPLGLRLQPDSRRLTLPRFLADVARLHGERTAISGESSQLSFTQLEARARALARGLVGAGVGKGSRVALLMANGPEWAVAAFGVSLTGAVLVPINTFATPGELDYMLRHSDASLLLMQKQLGKHAFLDDLASAHPELARGNPGRLRCPALPQLRRVVAWSLAKDGRPPGIDDLEGLLALGDDVSDELLDAVGEEITPADDAVIIYTSGTTAHPKGILHLQRAPVIQSWRFAEDMALSADDVVFTAQPFFWTAGMAMSLGASLAAGARLHTLEIFDPERALDRMEGEKVTTLHAWPHQEKALAEHPSAAGRDLSRLRKVEFASPMAALAGIEEDVWGTYGSYGMSETFTLASSLPSWTPAELRAQTSGKPLPGMQLRIVDVESGQPVAPGESGELAVKGVTFMRGYYKLEPEHFLDAEGFFRTQDGGFMDSAGYLHWKGRLSNLIKTGGANVSPLEIENALASRADIKTALAVGVPHPVLGEVIVLCVVPAADTELDAQELRGFLRGQLAVYKVPRRVLFFSAGDLQYTGTQKVQVGPLRDAALARLEAEGAEIEGHRYAVT